MRRPRRVRCLAALGGAHLPESRTSPPGGMTGVPLTFILYHPQIFNRSHSSLNILAIPTICCRVPRFLTCIYSTALTPLLCSTN